MDFIYVRFYIRTGKEGKSALFREVFLDKHTAIIYINPIGIICSIKSPVLMGFL